MNYEGYFQALFLTDDIVVEALWFAGLLTICFVPGNEGQEKTIYGFKRF